jgi:outer membrane immunogenic protein
VKKILAAAALVSAFVSTAVFAADMAVKAPVKALPPPVVYDWTGFYIGGQAGGAWTDTTYQSNHVSGVGVCAVNPGFLIACDPVEAKTNGFIGGGQLGVRWQTGPWVLGLEGTWTAYNRNLTTNSVSSPATLNYSTKVRDVYTATGQVGYAWDRALWYVKGGYAGAGLALDSNATGVTAPATVNLNGWTVGTGLDYAVIPNLILGVEYSHMHVTGSATTCSSPGSIFSCPTPAPPLQYANIKTDIDQVVARLSYQFNWRGAR